MARFYFSYKEPIVCTAIHAGHSIQPWIQQNFILSESEQLRDEDPFTDYFTLGCPNRIITDVSRFQIDVNRRRNHSIYEKPEDAWGLKLREEQLTADDKEKLFQFYDSFYETTKRHLEKLLELHPNVFVYDIHSYNHRKKGANAEPDAKNENPDIILGTNNMPEKWFPLVDSIQEKFSSQEYFNTHLDVRKNIKYPGGRFSRWLHETFPDTVCCIALEIKKIYMDEWTGLVDIQKQERLRNMLLQTFPIIKKFLANH